MAKRRKHFSFCFFKCIAAFGMAVILSSAPLLHASAGIVANGDLTVSVSPTYSEMFLDFFGNYATDGNDRNSAIPYTFRGSSYMTFSIARKADNFNFLSGSVSKSVTYSLATQTPGITWSHAPRPYIESVSLPQGVSVGIASYSGNGSSFSVTYRFSFDAVSLQNPLNGGFTVGFANTGYASASQFGSAYGRVQYSCSPAADWAGSPVFATDIMDVDPAASQFYKKLTSVTDYINQTNVKLNTTNSHLNNIYARQSTINGNITNQANTIAGKQDAINANITSQADKAIAQDKAHMANDDANRSRITAAMAEYTTDLREEIAVNTTSEIEEARKNSNNEIETANKNADDIMNSYDSTSQEGDNAKFDASQKQLQETEDSLFGSASGYFSGLDFSLFDIAKFTSVVSSLSFVSGLMQSLFVKMGDFGLIVTVGMVIMIASKVIGVYRFSTGDHG